MGEPLSMVDRWAVEEAELFELDDFDQPEQPAALVAHLPGRHDQSTHGRGGGGGAAAVGEEALAAAPLGLDRPGLSTEQTAAFEEYKGFFGYRRVNEQLRAGSVSGSTTTTVAHMDSAMQSSPLRTDVIVFRGDRDGKALFGDRFGGDLTGATLTSRAYLSTSASESFAHNWSRHGLGRESDPRNPVSMRILAPRGVGAVQLSGGEGGELLLQRGLQLRVMRDHGVVDGIRQIDIEAVAV